MFFVYPVNTSNVWLIIVNSTGLFVHLFIINSFAFSHFSFWSILNGDSLVQSRMFMSLNGVWGLPHFGWWPFDLSRRAPPERSQWKALLSSVGLLQPPKIATQWKLWFIRSSYQWGADTVVDTSGQTFVIVSSKQSYVDEFWGWNWLDPWIDAGANVVC